MAGEAIAGKSTAVERKASRLEIALLCVFPTSEEDQEKALFAHDAMTKTSSKDLFIMVVKELASLLWKCI